MGLHDEYGKKLLMAASKGLQIPVVFHGDPVAVRFNGTTGRIDALIGNRIGVEIESRVDKQVRGAIMDLLWHPSPQKLLILLPVHMHAPEQSVEMGRAILGRYLPARAFDVLVTAGSGERLQNWDEDVRKVSRAIARLIAVPNPSLAKPRVRPQPQYPLLGAIEYKGWDPFGPATDLEDWESLRDTA